MLSFIEDEFLHSDSAGNTSRYRACGCGCGFRALAVLGFQCAVADGAGAGTGELVGDFGEGLRVGVGPVCGLAVFEDGGAPVCCDGGELGCALDAADVGVVGDFLTGSVGGVFSEDAMVRDGGEATYSRTAWSSGVMPVGSGADSSEREGDVMTAGWRSLARVYAAA